MTRWWRAPAGRGPEDAVPIDDRGEVAAAGQAGHPPATGTGRLPAQLAHLEVTGRRERHIQRRIQDARFPMLKTLDAFSFEAQPDLDRNGVLQVFDCRFVANVVFVGGVGTGKTHLSIALGLACCQHDYRVRFVTAAELVTLLVEAQQQGRLARKLAQLNRFGVIILDELGYIPLDKAGTDLLFGFIRRRYERRSLVVTTNLPFAHWSEVFLNPTAAAALIDRIVHHATILQTTGDSYRLAAAKRSQAPAPARRKPVDVSGSCSSNAQRRRSPGVDDPRCRANQHDRVLAGVKARRYAPPPLREADGLETGCAHGHRQSLPDSPGTRFSQEGPELMS